MNDGVIWSQKEHNNWYVLQCDCFWLVTTVWAWCGLFLLLLLFCLFNEVKNSQQHNSGGLLLKEQVCLLQKQTCKKQSTIFFVCFVYSHNHIHIHICTALLFCFPSITSSALCLITLWHTEWRSRGLIPKPW